jgi:hypothetical protein
LNTRTHRRKSMAMPRRGKVVLKNRFPTAEDVAELLHVPEKRVDELREELEKIHGRRKR